MQMVEINSKNVDSITREGKTYLYFTAGFSPFAAAMEPVYQKFLMEAEQYDVKVCRINVTDDIALGERFHVKDLPTMLVFRDGMRVHTTEGIVLPVGRPPWCADRKALKRAGRGRNNAVNKGEVLQPKRKEAGA